MGSNYLSEHIFLVSFGASLLSRSFGTSGISHEVTGTWIPSNSSSNLQTDGSSFSCNGFCYALWEDCVSSGEHLWRIYIETEVKLLYAVLTTKEMFAEEWGHRRSYNQRVEPGFTAKILASFSDGKLKGYIGYNNQSLGQIVELEASALSKVCPAILYSGSGRVKIEKVTEIPPQSSRKNLRDFPEMEGKWYILPANFRIGDTNFSNFNPKFLKENDHNSLATLSIEKRPNARVGDYYVIVEVINRLPMGIRMHDGSWSNIGPIKMTFMGGETEHGRLESQMSNLIQSPDSVKIISGNLFVQKNEKVATFVR